MQVCVCCFMLLSLIGPETYIMSVLRTIYSLTWPNVVHTLVNQLIPELNISIWCTCIFIFTVTIVKSQVPGTGILNPAEKAIGTNVGGFKQHLFHSANKSYI